MYQYVYRGYRLLPDSAGTDFVFEATRDRRAFLPITVRLLETAVAECARRAGREIASNERYAIAKMTLFAAFDEYSDSAQLSTPLTPDARIIEEHLQALGRI